METYVIRQYFLKFLANRATLGPWNRSIECPNTRGTIKNCFPMKKYIGAVVRWSFQLVIGAEQDPFENRSPVPENVHLPGTLKNKTIFSLGQLWSTLALPNDFV